MTHTRRQEDAPATATTVPGQIGGKENADMAQSTHPDGFEHVPTVPELLALGLAMPSRTDANAFKLTAEGQLLVYGAMTRNADRAHANPALLRAAETAAIMARS